VRGVWLEPGDHRVVFEYPMPTALLAGILISSATILAAFAFVLIAVQRWLITH
jgi:hypothetical protein